jgi:hypothetical protein
MQAGQNPHREMTMPGEPEGGPDVGVAASGRQRGLRRAVTDATQDPPHRQPELAREVIGLIESALHRPERMERDRNHRIGAREQVAPGLAQQGGQRRGQHAAALVLERVDNPAKRAVIAAGTACD